MKLLTVAGALILAIGAVTPATAVTLELSGEVTKEINVTTDSSPGWIPAIEQRQRAIKTIEVFLEALERARDEEAYAMLAALNQRQETLELFTQNSQKFRAVAGPSKFWRVQKVTWTKDPARAPFPGFYAAIDLTAQFANADRYCGYIVVYQRPEGGNFTIMRRESTYLDNATARSIDRSIRRQS
jgi:hypothetical protein